MIRLYRPPPVRALARQVLRAFASVFVALSIAGPFAAGGAVAADKPLYEPPPAWVKAAPIPDRPRPGDGSPIQMLLMDEQSFLGADGDELYGESAYRILTPQGLGPSGNIVLTWRPDTEVLAIHKAVIIRDGRVIDLLAGGKTFTVLRRETNLEMAMLDGTLTATLQAEGLQVGDIVDIATTLKRHDPVLHGISEDFDRLTHAGVAARVRFREIWPDAKPVRWRATEGLPKPSVLRQAGQTELTLDLTDVTAPKPPFGAPARFQQLGSLEFSQFADWAQLSALMAPLYKSATRLAPDSPLRAEVAKIAASTSDPKARAMAALKLVQERTRYLYLGMDEGGYVPADADTTWSRRFGDCKAKTALLVALLTELGVDAQPAMVNAFGADGLDQRLPMLRAFNHVIVRATIGGKTYWLDGARTGDRDLDDIRTPSFDWALPIQASGAVLVKLERQPLAQPSVTSSLNIDASHGFDARANVRAQIEYRGEEGLAMRQQLSALPAADNQRYLREYWTKSLPWLDVSDVGSKFDEASGVLRLTMAGAGQMEWSTAAGGRRFFRVPNTSMGYEANFKREPGPNQDAPFAQPFPFYQQSTISIVLPTLGQGAFTLLGEDLDTSLAGMRLVRTSRLDGSSLNVSLTQRSLGPEVSAEQARADAPRLRQMGQTAVAVVYDATASAADQNGRPGGSAPAALLAAAQAGHADAQRDLGKLYLEGRSVPMDPEQARVWLGKAADQGDAAAEIALAQMYVAGLGGDQDPDKAAALFAKAADTGNPEAQAALGYAYQHGLGVRTDLTRAIDWYRKAADQGIVSAQVSLGVLYCCSAAPKDDAEAVRWFRKAADKGDAVAEDDMGIMYRDGRGVPADLQEARRWWEKSADQGNAIAENSLGAYYSSGAGGPQASLAVIYFRKAADQGLVDAEVNLAGAYLWGVGVPKDAGQAAFWYRKAAAKGNIQAQRQLELIRQSDAAPAAASAPPTPSAAVASAPPPSDPRELAVRGRDLEATGDVDSAIKAFSRAIEARPQDATYRMDRARALARKGQDDQALADVGQAIALAPQMEAAYLLRGEIYARTGRTQAAVDDFSAAVTRAPRDPEPLKSRAEAYAVMRRYSLAIADLTQAIALAPKRADLLEERSQANRFEGATAAAKADLDAAIGLQPSAVGYFLRSSLYGPSNVEASRADLDAALRLQPNYSSALEARAKLFLQAGDLPQAARDFDAGLKVASDPVGFLEQQAIAYEGSGHYDLAVQAFDSVIARRPGNARDFSNRCWTKGAWGQQLQSALSDCNTALAQMPADGLVLFNRGFVYLRLGQFDQAIVDFTAAIEKGPKVAAALYWRGVAKRRKGLSSEADSDLAAAQAIDPRIATSLARYGVPAT